MVTKVSHKISKTGNGWGAFEISDYDGMLEFRLFGEDYQKFKHLLEEGMIIFLKGKFQKGWRNEEEMELKVLDIRLLEGIGRELAEAITLKLHVERLSATLIDELDELCKQYRGPHKLRIELIDNQAKTKVSMLSGGVKVNADTEFTKHLERMGVDYALSV